MSAATKPCQLSKVQNILLNPLKRTPKYKNKNNIKPNCPLRGPVNDINLCKFIQVQAKFMNYNCPYAPGGGGSIKFTVAKKRLDNGEYLNMVVALAMAEAIKMNKNSKAKATGESKSWNDLEHLNFGKLDIEAESHFK